MNRLLTAIPLGTMDATSWMRTVAGLEGPDARLLCARLSGATLALGRFQRDDVTISHEKKAIARVRRSTGGRLLALGDGMLAVALVVPSTGWLSGEEDLPAARFLNRAVRGVLSALQSLGVSAMYGGRDFVTIDASQGAYASFDVRPDGSALFTCELAAETHWSPPDACLLHGPLPVSRGFPEGRCIEALVDVTDEAFLEALLKGYRERFGVDVAVTDLEEELRKGSVAAPQEVMRWSLLAEIASGRVGAGVTIGAGGVIESAVIHGDFLADSAGILELERRLVGCTPTIEGVAGPLNAVFGDPRHAMIGVKDLEVVAKALVEAAA